MSYVQLVLSLFLSNITKIKLRKQAFIRTSQTSLNVGIPNEEWIKSIINGPRMWSNQSYFMDTSSPLHLLQSRRRVAWADNHTGVPVFLHHESDRNLTSSSDVTTAH